MTCVAKHNSKSILSFTYIPEINSQTSFPITCISKTMSKTALQNRIIIGEGSAQFVGGESTGRSPPDTSVEPTVVQIPSRRLAEARGSKGGSIAPSVVHWLAAPRTEMKYVVEFMHTFCNVFPVRLELIKSDTILH